MYASHTQPRRISDTLGAKSFRNGIGYVLFAFSTIIPSVDAWQYGSETLQASTIERPLASRSSFSPRGMNGGRRSVREQMNSSWWPDTGKLMWLFSRTMIAVIGTTLSLILLMPFSGCKRFAILFGPPTGLIAMSSVSLWLAGREEIYRFEPVIVGVFAALPTAALWFWCCKWAYERPVHSPHIIVAEAVNDHRTPKASPSRSRWPSE